MDPEKNCRRILTRGLLACALFIPTSLAGCAPVAGEDEGELSADDSLAAEAVAQEAGGWFGGALAPTAALVRGDAPSSASASRNGPYWVESYSWGYRDGWDYADSTIHYPTNAEPPFAIVAVVPGFLSPQFTIQGWGPFLASHGIVTMTIGTNFLTDLPGDRANALWDALQTLKSENSRALGPLQGKIDESRMGVMGWSMGGGGTLMVAQDHPEIKATISLCGWNPAYPYFGLQVPALMFAGTADVLAGGQSQGFYESIPNSTKKMLYEVNFGGHLVANDPSGEWGAIGRYGLSWMKVFLEGDERYQQFLLETPSNASDFRHNLGGEGGGLLGWL